MKLIEDRGITVAQAKRDSGVHGTVLHRWVREEPIDPQQAFHGRAEETGLAGDRSPPTRDEEAQSGARHINKIRDRFK
ncbi:MAG: hypothetical protein AB7L09_03980 [Nitrospira sp.]